MIKKILCGLMATVSAGAIAHAQTISGQGPALQLGNPVTQISITDPKFGGIAVTAPGGSAPSAGVMTANTATINSILSKYCKGTSNSTQLTQQPAVTIWFPGYIIDVNGVIDARAYSWGCRLEGVAGNTILRVNGTGVQGLQLGGHGIAARGITVWYNTVAGTTAAELNNLGNGGSNCFELWGATSFEFDELQCYGGARGMLIPWTDASAYGTSAGKNWIFSGTLSNWYSSSNSFRHLDFPITVNWAGTGYVASGAFTVSSTTNPGGNTLSTGMLFYCTGQDTSSATTISSGSGTSWTLNRSITIGSSGAPVACYAGKLSGNGTGITLNEIYGTNNSSNINMGYVFGGTSLAATTINDERGYVANVATPQYGLGGDGLGASGEFFFTATQNCTLTNVHTEGNVYYANNLGVFANSSATNCTVNGLDVISLNATTGNGATNAYIIKPFGSQVFWRVNGLNDGGSSGSIANTVTNPIGMVYTGNSLTSSAISFGPIAHQSGISISESPSAVPSASNGQAVFSRTPPGTFTTYPSHGTFTYTPRPDSNTQTVFVCGAGGGGGGGAQETLGTVATGGAGGGGGSCFSKKFRTSELGTTVTVVVGQGGTAGSATSVNGAGGAGGIGGDSNFGGLIYGYAGGGGSGGQISGTLAGGGGAGGCSGDGGSGSSGTAGTAGGCGGAAGGLGAIGTSGLGVPGGGGGSSGTASASAQGSAANFCPGGASGGTLLVGTATAGGAGGALGGQTQATAGANTGGTGGNGAQLSASQTGGSGGGGGANTAGAGGPPGTSANCAGGSGSGAGTSAGNTGAVGGDGIVTITEN